MASFNQSPITPEKQLTSSDLNIDLNSSILDEINCTPNTKNQMLSMKRKASQVLNQSDTRSSDLYFEWRLAVVESQLKTRESQRQALAESNKTFFDEIGKSKEELKMTIKRDRKVLSEEKAFLISHKIVLKQDWNEVSSNRKNLEDAYIRELRITLDDASKSKIKLSGLKSPKLDRKVFKKIVHEYLGTKRQSPDTEDTMTWCNVLGFWLGPDSVKCAHIVPQSFDTKSMAHIFGTDEPPLQSRRNGLSLQAKIEEAFDNCWIVIVPVDSVDSIPTKWKIVLLNTAEKDKTFFRDLAKLTDRELWRWRDIDGRQLTFLNDNRPARRFLYMRYALAWFHAHDKSWPNFQEKVPPGKVWASPNKPDGYLRQSILLEIGKRIGDELPEDLIRAGTFQDPDSSSVVHDEVASIRCTELIRDHLEGARDVKVKDKDDEDEDESMNQDDEEDLMNQD
jgi:HNH endonuclease